MLKKILTQGVRLKKRMLWVCAVILLLMTTAVAQVATDVPADQVTNNINTVIINDYGLGVPFTKSWFGIWFFGLGGGIGATFIVMQDIDKHFRHPAIAKIFLGIFGGVSLCLILVKSDPPSQLLIAYSFLAALLAAPLLQFALATVAVRENLHGIFNALLSLTPIKYRFGEGEKKGDGNE